MRGRILLACLCAAFAAFLGLAGCATKGKPGAKTQAQAAAAPAETPHVPEVIGTISLVNASLGFALVDVSAMDYPGVGVALKSFADGKETAILMVSPEKNRPFIIADIVKGMPNKGDVVYQ